MQLLNKTFSAADVVIAANIAPETLQNWLKRDLIIGQNEGEAKIAGGGSRGKRRQYAWEHLVTIAAAAALVDAGMQPTEAFKAAHGFAMVSTGPSAVWEGEAANDAAPYRAPSFPYHHSKGETFLCTWADQRRVILSADGSINPRQIMGPKHPAKGMIAVNMSELLNQIAARLDLGHPYELLDQVYSKIGAV